MRLKDIEGLMLEPIDNTKEGGSIAFKAHNDTITKQGERCVGINFDKIREGLVQLRTPKDVINKILQKLYDNENDLIVSRGK